MSRHADPLLSAQAEAGKPPQSGELTTADRQWILRQMRLCSPSYLRGDGS